ncbi:hypothetical protein Tco_0944803, partial [Tanacetum coccineum]
MASIMRSHEVLHLFRILDHVVIEKTNINPAEVGDIIVGSVLESGSQRASECMMAPFYAAYPDMSKIQEISFLDNKWCQLELSIDSIPQVFRRFADVAATIKATFYDN